jgi:SAM-dependent methyltransferase
MTPRDRPDNRDLYRDGADLQQIYQARFGGRSTYRQQVWRVLCRFFRTWIPSDATVLDLGCGYCEFINAIDARQKYGMDLNPDARGFAAPGVTVLEQNCAEPWAVPAESLDVVFSSNFLEHLPDKTAVEQTLAHARRALRAGGTIVLMGPNIKYAPGAYWDFSDHYVALTERSLEEVLTRGGFQVDTCVGRFLPYTMSSGRTYPMWMLRLYLSMPWAWRFFGKQFLLVARKPQALEPPA